MGQDEYKRVAEDEQIQEGKATVVKLDDKEVLLTKVGGEICACGNSCPHAGAPLSDGIVQDGAVVCPWHNAKFDLRDGSLQAPPAMNDLPVYDVDVRDGQVLLGAATKPTIQPVSNGDQRVFLILGAGAAGALAAETLRREGFGGEIIMYSAETDLPYDRTLLSKEMITGEAKPSWLPLRSASFYERLNIQFKGGYKVKKLDPKEKTIYFENGERQKGDKILLATGSKPRYLNVGGREKNNVFLLRSAKQGKDLVKYLDSAKSAIIVGAGFLGLEVAAGLAQRKIETCIVAPDNEPLESVLGTEIGQRMRLLHENKGVRFHLGKTVKEILGDDSVQGVVLSDDTKIKADCVVIGVGVDPVIDYLEGTSLTQSGVVPVSPLLETKASDIYAAGDIASIRYESLGESVRVEHWVAAQSQGRHAAKAMAGATDPYREIPFFWTRQYNVSIKYIGYGGKPEQIVFRGDPGKGPFVAGFYRRGKLVGAATIGMDRLLYQIEGILKSGKELPPDTLKDPNAALL